MSKSFFKGAVTALPIIFGYFFIGFAAGALAARVGMSVLEVSLLSLLVFAGSAQFVFAPLYTGSAAVLIFTIFLFNLRHFLYSLAVILPYVRRLSMFLKSRFFIGAQLHSIIKKYFYYNKTTNLKNISIVQKLEFLR